MHDTGTTIAVFIALFSTIYLTFITRKVARNDKFLRNVIKALVIMNIFILTCWVATL